MTLKSQISDRPPVVPCHRCGHALDILWANVTALGDPELRHIEMHRRCTTEGCVPRCPTCLRTPGDIHGPHCGPIMFDKLTFWSARITPEDCT